MIVSLQLRENPVRGKKNLRFYCGNQSFSNPAYFSISFLAP